MLLWQVIVCVRAHSGTILELSDKKTWWLSGLHGYMCAHINSLHLCSQALLLPVRCMFYKAHQTQGINVIYESPCRLCAVQWTKNSFKKPLQVQIVSTLGHLLCTAAFLDVFREEFEI